MKALSEIRCNLRPPSDPRRMGLVTIAATAVDGDEDAGERVTLSTEELQQRSARPVKALI